MAQGGYPVVGSLDRGLRALKLFNAEVQELSVSDMATRLDIPSASAYRMVSTLERHGFLRRDPESRMLKLGFGLIELGALVQQGLDVRAAARPVMQRLSQVVGDTSVLAVPDESSAVCVEVFEGSWPIRPRSASVGEHLPYHLGASSLALLAFLPPSQQDEVLSELPRSGPRSASKLRERLAEVRVAGYAHSSEELLKGTAAVAAPIFAGGQSFAVASLAITGIVDRIEGLEETILAAAAEITSVLGGVVEESTVSLN